MVASTKSGGGGKLMNKQLILVVLIAFALLIHTPAGLPMIGAFVLLIATVFCVYHNGVQVSDAVVFFVLGVFLASTYLGDGSRNVINTVVDWVSQMPVAG
jgi:hypothetical protein